MGLGVSGGGGPAGDGSGRAGDEPGRGVRGKVSQCFQHPEGHQHQLYVTLVISF